MPTVNALRAACPVAVWCQQPLPVCGLCADGSDYRPGPGAPRHPQAIEHADARAAARRAHRAEPAVQRGRANRLAGRQAERRVARLLGGAVVPGSGQLDGLPNDVCLPDGWRAEVRRRTGGFRTLYAALAAADLALWTPASGPVLVALWADRLALLQTPHHLTAPWSVTRLPPARVGSLTRWLLHDRRERPDCLLLWAPPRPWLCVTRLDALPFPPPLSPDMPDH